MNVNRDNNNANQGDAQDFILYPGDAVKSWSYNQNNSQYGLKVIGSEFAL